jgi:hypothetical protein
MQRNHQHNEGLAVSNDLPQRAAARALRGTASPPPFVQAERRAGRRYPWKFAFELGRGELTLQCRRSAWWPIGDPSEVRCREMFIWLGDRHRPDGAVEMVEYRTDIGFGRQFSGAMDDESMEAGELALELGRAWAHAPFVVGDLGSVVLVRAAWVRPGPGSHRQWSEIVGRVLEALTPAHAIVAMQAMPLRSIDGEDRRPVSREVRQRRSRALARHYANLFGAWPLRPRGVASWLWFPNPDLAESIPEPKRCGANGAASRTHGRLRRSAHELSPNSDGARL